MIAFRPPNPLTDDYLPFPGCALCAPPYAVRRRTLIMNEMERGDYHVAVRRREHTETPWRWEIWAAGKSKAVEHSEGHYATMSGALKHGKAALKELLRKRFPDAA
jgi:hypothetical protein